MIKSKFAPSRHPPLTPPAASLSQHEQATLAKAYRTARNGWLYLHIEGAPEERGFQHGYLMAAEIREILEMTRFVTKFSTGEEFDYFVDEAMKMYPNLLDDEIIAEIKGIAEGSTKAGVPLSFAQALAWNANIEMMWSWWPMVKGKPPGGRLLRHHHCSAFIATGKGITQDGGIVLAHNTWDTFLNSNAFRLMLDIAPACGHRILMQSAPGLIHSGTDFFVTAGGLVGCETTIAGFSGYDATKLPEFYRVRRAMQYANDLGQWIKTMTDKNNGGYANCWLIGDIKTSEIGRLELGLKYAGIERSKKGYFWGCNLVVDPRIRNQECSGVDYSDVMANAGRRVRWESLLERNSGKINRAVAQKMIADHYDAAVRKNNPSTRSICGHFDCDPAETVGWGFGPFEPYGANDAKITDTRLAKDMSVLARFGRPCGTKFDAKAFLKKHPQYAWQEGFLRSKPKRPWTRFP
jgi:hypothetical protein